MDKREIQELIKQYISGQCSSHERGLVERWYAHELQERLAEMKKVDRGVVKEEIWRNIVSQRSQIKKSRKEWIVWTGAAAMLLVGLFTTFLMQKNTDRNQGQIVAHEQKVLPGGNKAVLTMGNGKKFILTDEENGVIEQQNGFIVRKEEDGLISFEMSRKNDEALQLVNNTVETPKGGIYRIVLPDSSKVWLNSASSISFPSNFSKKEKRVSIKGEVYFEIRKDISRPFRVDASEQKIEVLGTKFNINAYEDEPNVRTTLLEGRVKVKGAEHEQVLKPGFEMITTRSGNDKVGKADLEAVMAWKEGVFQFDRVALDVLMRQLARWYDVDLDVTYLGEYSKDEFVGKIKRKKDIRSVLEILKLGNINISLEGRKLIVVQKKRYDREIIKRKNGSAETLPQTIK